MGFFRRGHEVMVVHIWDFSKEVMDEVTVVQDTV